jgi:hypothetical protein
MTFSPTIYDWRQSCAPISQVVRAGGISIDGGITLGGAATRNPEPGGRAELVMDFDPFVSEQANRDASWTVSRIMNGSVFRVRLYRTVQLVPEADLPVTDGSATWASGLPFANDVTWRANPWVPVAAAALKGASTVRLDLSPLGEVLQVGHLIGFSVDGYDFCHVVMDIDYGSDATVTVSPPLRRALATTDVALLRPAMLAVCINPEEVMTNFRSGRHMRFAQARFVEALV